MEWEELKKILDQHLLQLIANEKEHIKNNGPRSAVIKEIWAKEDLPHYKQEFYNISHGSDSEDFPLQISSPVADEILKKK